MLDAEEFIDADPKMSSDQKDRIRSYVSKLNKGEDIGTEGVDDIIAIIQESNKRAPGVYNQLTS